MTPQGHRRLILTRHAKSAWDDPSMADQDRPLNRRGRRSALELGEWLHSRDYEPDQVLCSTAVRTRETWSIAASAPLEVMPRVDYLDSLYNAGPDVLLRALARAKGDTVMLIAHNPGIAEFAGLIVARAPNNADFARYPTAATLVADFQIPAWDKVALGQASALDFFIPSGRD